MKQHYIIVDGTSYIYRAFFAMPPLTSPAGNPTGVIYGVVNMLRKLIKQHPANNLTIVFDPPGPTTRHEFFPQYKANRKESPQELIMQIKPTIDLIKAFGWPTLTIPTIEADDVIGSLAIQALRLNYEVLISTADKDFAQLVQPGITLINTMSNKTLDTDGVLKKFQVPPNQIIDYLALVGDSSDNIPGIAKVGPKTAVKWLQEWGSIDKIVAASASIGGKVGENLRNSLDDLAIYKKLVTINTDLEIKIQDHCQPKPRDVDQLARQLEDLGFKIWLQQLSVQQPQKKQLENNCLTSANKWGAWQTAILTKQIIAIHSYRHQKKHGLGIMNDGKSVFLAFSEMENKDIDTILKDLQDFLNNPQNTIIGHDLKNDWHYLTSLKLKVKTQMYDLKICSYLIHGSTFDNTLASLATKYLGYNITANLTIVDLEAASEQANRSVFLIESIYPMLKKIIDKEPKEKQLLHEVELPLITVLAEIEKFGVLLNTKELIQQSKYISEKITTLEKEAHQLADCDFNLNSPKQLREILFNRFNLPVIKKTASGDESTAEEVLTKLKAMHPIAEILLQHRHLSKLQNTYCAKLTKEVDANNRVHCQYNQALTSTGRLSSQQPNLQNIPVKTEIGKEIRKTFIAEPGYSLLSADYNQIELRVMAHFSQDKALCSAFQNNLDIHSMIASQLFNCKLDQVSDQQRRVAKTVNFGLIYGMSAFGLAEQLQLDRSDAQKLIDKYFQQFSQVKQYLTNTRQYSKQNGFVTTLLGKKVHLPQYNNPQQANANARAAINAPIQGTAAEIIKIAMLNLAKKLKKEKLQAQIILQVHDELVLETADQDIQRVSSLVKQTMENSLKLSVPLLVSIGVGENWADAH